MNVLDIPWAATPKAAPKVENKGESVGHYLGRRNEAVKAAQGVDKTISVEVRGVKGVPSGAFRLAFVEGQALKVYLKQLKILRTATKSAVYDFAHKEKGRIKQRYVPVEDSQIVIGPPSMGMMLQYQRKSETHSSKQQTVEVKLWR
jgi:hypothetical protein